MNWFSKQQLIYQTWPVYATQFEFLTFCCPFDLFTLFLPFPFPGFEYFADGREFALPLRRRGVLCGGTQCGWLHLAILFLVWKKKKSNTLNNQYRFVIISLLMSFSILSQIVILNQYRVWGNDQQMQTADLTIKTQCYKVTLDVLSYVVDTIVPFHYMLVQCRYLSFTKYLTPHLVTLVDCMNGQKVLIVGSINTQPESSRLQNSMNINTHKEKIPRFYISPYKHNYQYPSRNKVNTIKDQSKCRNKVNT